jgi:hypothetical protein
MEGAQMSDTPISDSTPHNVAELGMLCRRIERELNAANKTNRLQYELITTAEKRGVDKSKEELNAAKDRIKRLEEGGGLALGYASKGDFESADEVWLKAKEAKL